MFLDFQTDTKVRICKIQCSDGGPGLIYRFRCSEMFKQHFHTPLKSPGYWKFDGDNIDTEGEFVKIQMTDELETYMKELQQKLARQQEEVKEEKRMVHERLKSYFGPDVSSGANILKAPSEKDKNPDELTNPNMIFHAMVLVGGLTEHVKVKDCSGKVKLKPKEHFLLVNSWRNMPLVLVSSDYLAACGAEILFRQDAPLHVSRNITTNPALVVDCASPLPKDREDEELADLFDAFEIFEEEDQESIGVYKTFEIPSYQESSGDY
mmetsp:Transcript_11799/g.21252  ORF Transcript_11799/g.21252 Transcript_11799/m.21252 type:complete len:265 (+) Transcript_11799:3-797(+)